MQLSGEQISQAYAIARNVCTQMQIPASNRADYILLDVVENAGEYCPQRGAWSTFVHKLAVNTICNHRQRFFGNRRELITDRFRRTRSQMQRLDCAAAAALVDEQHARPATSLDDLRNAVGELPLDQRDMLQLQYGVGGPGSWNMGGLTTRQTATALNVPLTTVKSALHRARGNLREFLSTHPSGS